MPTDPAASPVPPSAHRAAGVAGPVPATRRARASLTLGVAGLVLGTTAVLLGVLAPRAAPTVALGDLGVVTAGPGPAAAEAAAPASRPHTTGVGGPTAGSASTSSASRTGSAGPAAVEAEVVAAPPVSLELPRQGVVAPVLPAGVRADGQLQLPDDPASTGWWAAGPAPGEAGSVLVGGHVRTAARGPGALAALGDIAVGDAVVLVDSLGHRHAYAVESRRSYPKTALPVDLLVGADGTPRLVLVTCGGEVDAGGRYEDNVVVTAVPSS